MMSARHRYPGVCLVNPPQAPYSMTTSTVGMELDYHNGNVVD